jgi:hypothetical protein
VNVFISWEQLAELVEQAAKTRMMFREERHAYLTVAHQLREETLVGRRCSGCQGPLMERSWADGTGRELRYSCACPGHEVLDPSDGWIDVRPYPHEIEGGLHLETP